MAASPVKVHYLPEVVIVDPIGALASSGGLLIGKEFAEVDNSSDKALDYGLSGRVKVGNTPAAGIIEILVVAQIQGGTYPYPFTGLDAGLTLANRNSIDNAIVRAFVIETDATADGLYDFGPISVKSLFGGIMPQKFAVGIVHSTGDNLHATIGYICAQPQYLDVGT